MGRLAAFIDGAYLDFLLRNEFGLAKIDYDLLANKLAGSHDVLRTYYYNCLPYQSNPPTTEEAERFGKKQSFYATLTRLTKFEVRLGRLAYRGIDKNTGKALFEQKRVDIMLGVDLTLLAAEHTITHASLLAGDSDFLPAISVAKNRGVSIHLFHGQRPHNELWDAADERTVIDRAFIDKIPRKDKPTPT